MSGHDPTITVGIATLDRYEYVRTLLDDLAVQTHLPDEVLIVDQTAPHKRQPIPTSNWSESFPVRVITQDARGITKARNLLLCECGSEILLLSDDDVRIEPDYVHNHVRHFADDRVDVVSGPVYEWDAKSHEWYVKWKNHLLLEGPDGSAFVSTHSFSGTNSSVRVSSGLAIGGWDENILTHGEDEDFSDRLHTRGSGPRLRLQRHACCTSGRREGESGLTSGAAGQTATGGCSPATCTTTWQTGPRTTLGQ